MFNPVAIAQKIPPWAIWLTAAGVALYVIKKGSLQAAAQGVTAGVVGSVGGVVKGAAGGVVLGAGDILGVPRTSIDRCKKAILIGDNQQAFSYCSAGVYGKWQYLSLRRKLTGQNFTMSDIFN